MLQLTNFAGVIVKLLQYTAVTQNKLSLSK